MYDVDNVYDYRIRTAVYVGIGVSVVAVSAVACYILIKKHKSKDGRLVKVNYQFAKEF
ncbi:MAG: hypothetical protein FWG10_11880 [Eubacteriaceae bacterium]|nr:hypothetical protein [Eubacteriaceae bacterium]